MSKVYLLNGLPGSGKSTWARNKIKKDPDTLILSRDDFRTILHGGTYVFDKKYEELILDIEDYAIRACIEQGFDVIIDETNLKQERRLDLIELADNATIICVIFTETENNLKNRMTTSRGYTDVQWEEVILKMKKDQVPVSENEPYDQIIYVSNPNDPSTL
jgi:predicted kinase